MRAALRRLRPELAVPPLLAATIFLFACGSSSLAELGDAGRRGRWVGLFALLALAALAAIARGIRPERLAAVAAPAALLVGLALVSALWSVAPRLTLERAGTFAVVVAVAGILAAAGDERTLRHVVLGIVAGATAVALAGLVFYAVSPAQAVHEQPGLLGRFRGIGQSPNTTSMLFALSLGPALLVLVRARAAASRAVAGGALLLVASLLIASGSRGAEVGGFLGILAFGAAGGRTVRLPVALAAVAFLAAGVGVGLAQTGTPRAPAQASTTSSKPNPLGALDPGALDAELGHDNAQDTRSFLGGSGRGQAWSGAIRLGERRPALGFGFGTEDRVFVDRYYAFQGDYVENSWIGLYLQLGLVGLASLVAVWAAALALAVRVVVRRPGELAAALAAVLLAALPLTFVESWLYSAGNVATLPFWVALLALPVAVAGRAAPAPEPFAVDRRSRFARAATASRARPGPRVPSGPGTP